MVFSASRMDEVQFERVASKCKWSERSLNVARALIIHDVPLAEAAAVHTMSPQQANVVRSRFLAKAERMRVEDFMQREKPESHAPLESFANEIQMLRDNGYSPEQIISFLKENGVSASRTAVRTLFKSRIDNK